MWRFRWLAWLIAAVTVAAPAYAASDATFQALLASPDDPILNRRFAVEAEARGELRHALAALERARQAHPGDQEIAAEYDRIRRKMLPTVTTVTVQTGVSYASNPREVTNTSALRRRDGIADVGVSIEDERTLGDTRWRSHIIASGQFDEYAHDLNTARLSAEAGPVLALSRDQWLHLAPGATVVMLGNEKLYDELSGAATYGTLYKGLTQQVMVRFGWRQGNQSEGISDSKVFDILGRFVVSPSLVHGDYFYLQPRFHISSASNALSATYIANTVLGPSTEVARDLSPFSYNEWGARGTYMFPVMQGKVYLGAGLALYDRHYDSFVLDPASLTLGVPVNTTQKRQDFYIEPTAHIIFPNLLAPKVDFRIDYRFEDNLSNDSYRSFQNHVVGMRVIGRY